MVQYRVVTKRFDMNLEDLFPFTDQLLAVKVMRVSAKQERLMNPNMYVCTYLRKEGATK